MHLWGSIDSRTNNVSASLKILVKDGSICFINMFQSSKEDSLLSSFVNRCHGKVVNISMAGGYQRYSDFNWTCKYRLFSSDEAVNLVCGSVLGDTAAVGLSGGDMVVFSFNYGPQDVQTEVMRISRSNLSVESSVGFSFLQKFFGGGAPTGNGDILGEGSELLVVELTREHHIISVTKSGTIRVHKSLCDTLFCELDILRSLVADYNIVLGATSLVDVRISTSSEGFFSIGMCIRVKAENGCEHLEWHVAVLQLLEHGGLVWKLVDFSVAHPRASRLSLIDLSLSPRSVEGNEEPKRSLITKWCDEMSPVQVLTDFSNVERGNSIALQCNSSLLDVEEESEEVLHDEIIGEIVRKNGGWEVGVMRKLTPHGAQIMLKMTRLQRIFAPGRFSLHVIVACLKNDVPVPFNGKFLSQQGLTTSAVAETLCSMCDCWAQDKLHSEGSNFEHDKGRTGPLDYLDLCFLEFTRLCHSRQVAVDVKMGHKACWVDSGVVANLEFTNSCVLLPNAQGFSMLYLPEVASQGQLIYKDKSMGQLSEQHDQSAEKRALLQLLQRVDSALSRRSKLEFEFNFAQLCMQSSKFDTNSTQWLHEQGLALASQLAIDDSLNSQLEALARDDKLLLAVNDLYALESIEKSNECSNLPSSFRYSLFADIAASYVLRQYRHSRTLLVTLSFLCNRRSLLSAATNSVLQTKYLPIAIHNTAYYGLLQWLGTVRPTDATDLRRLFDLYDVFPNSKVLSQRKASARNYLESSLTNEYVLRNFWKHLDDHSRSFSTLLSLEEATKLCAWYLRPSCMGDFCRYLLHEGQFAVLHKLSSLLIMRLNSLEEVSSDKVSSEICSLARFGRNMQAHRILTYEGVANFYETLRVQVSKSRSGQPPSETDERTIKKALERLLEAALEPSISPDAFQIISKRTAEEVSSRKSVREAIVSWSIPGFNEFFPAMSKLEADDMMFCVRDTLERVVDENEVLVHLIGSGSDSDMTKLLLDHISFVERVVSISHVRDVLELLKRARVALRHETGASLSLHGGYMLMRMIKDTTEKFSDLMDDSALIYETLNTDLATAWGRIFNSALESHSFDQAVSAIVQMIELDETHHLEHTAVLEAAQDKNVIQPWKACLRSLVTLACESGNLEWLCNMPDIKVGLVLLTDYVCAELSRLAKTRGFSNNTYNTTNNNNSTLSYTGVINYTECLFCFHMTRSNFREAAGAMFAHANRLDSSGPGAREITREAETLTSMAFQSQFLAVTICTLRLCESSQAYLISNAFCGTSLECVTLEFMATQFWRLRARCMGKLPLNAHSDDIVKVLCGFRRWTHVFAAMQLSSQEIKLASMPDSPSIAQCIPRASQLLCDAVAALAELCASTVASKHFREIDMIAPFSYPCDPVGVQTDPYRLLVDTLRALDSAEINWALHRSAIDKLLRLNPTQVLPGPFCDSLAPKVLWSTPRGLDFPSARAPW